VDLPYESVGGQLKQIEGIWQKWLIYDPVAMVAGQEVKPQELRAIHFDCGTADEVLIDSRAFADALTAAGVPYVFETHDGGHLNRVAQRVETRVLPFFSEELEFEAVTTAVEPAAWGVVKTSF
jgi:S-formylglutathione hydrolase FrmB